MTDELTDRLKQQITDVLNLQPRRWDGIKANDPLFGARLGLDSVDALELIVLLERDYNIRITDPKLGRQALESLDSMAQFIRGQQDPCSNP